MSDDVTVIPLSSFLLLLFILFITKFRLSHFVSYKLVFYLPSFYAGSLQLVDFPVFLWLWIWGRKEEFFHDRCL